MTISAAYIGEQIVIAMQDTDSIRWPIAQVRDAINAAQREIILHRPDAKSKTETGTLATGTLQNLSSIFPSGKPAKLLEITRNMAATSNKRVIRLIPRGILDDQSPSWPAANPTINITHYCYDEREPLRFYVNPPATTAAQVEIKYSAYPTDIGVPTGTTYDTLPGNLDVADIYANAVINYALFWLYRKDAAYAGNLERAVASYQAFASDMGIELKGTLSVSPTSNDTTFNTSYPKV